VPDNGFTVGKQLVNQQPTVLLGGLEYVYIDAINSIMLIKSGTVSSPNYVSRFDCSSVCRGTDSDTHEYPHYYR
jgi:hypothetical protein